MATAAMPDVKYEVPHTVDHEDGTARKQTQERQAQGTGCNSWWSTPCHLTPELVYYGAARTEKPKMTLSTDVSHTDAIPEVPDVLLVPDAPLKKQRSMRIDLTGQEFPCGTVVEYAYAKRKRAYWKVQCRFCGTLFSACGRDLRKGNPVKCPCQKLDPEHLVGKPFGRGVVRARAGKTTGASEEACWALECECGRIYRAKTSDLTSGRIVSCGCWRKERMAEMNTDRALARHGAQATGLPGLEHSDIITALTEEK